MASRRPSTTASAPWPGTASKDFDLWKCKRTRLGRLDDRLGEWVFAVAFCGRDETQHLVLREAVRRRDQDDLRLTARQRAGLVEHHRV